MYLFVYLAKINNKFSIYTNNKICEALKKRKPFLRIHTHCWNRKERTMCAASFCFLCDSDLFAHKILQNIYFHYVDTRKNRIKKNFGNRTLKVLKQAKQIGTKRGKKYTS